MKKIFISVSGTDSSNRDQDVTVGGLTITPPTTFTTALGPIASIY